MTSIIKTTVLLFILLISTSCHSKSGNNHNLKDYVSVTKIVDGDTFWVDNGTEKGEKVRLIGVDTPETRRTGKKEIGYYGQEAKAFASKLISGKLVKLVFDVDKYDQYNRTLAYVYLEDGTFLNAELVKQGYAMVMTVPPNVRFVDTFLQLQQEARENNRGLWGKSGK
jgi:micrococcal nuclease